MQSLGQREGSRRKSGKLGPAQLEAGQQQAAKQGGDPREQRFTAPDMGRALRQLNDALGPDAILLSSRKVADGVEVIALPPGLKPSTDDFASLHSDRRNADRRAKDRSSDGSQTVDDTNNRFAGANTGRRSSDGLTDEVYNNPNEQGFRPSAEAENNTGQVSKSSLSKAINPTDMSSAASRLAEKIGAMGSPFNDASAFENLQQELSQVRQMLEQKIDQANPVSDIFPNPLQYVLINRVLQMGFPLELAKLLTQGLESEMFNLAVLNPASSNDQPNEGSQRDNVERGWLLCLERLEAILPVLGARSANFGISQAGANNAVTDIAASGGIIALLGPNGAGKSSAIAKLAGRWLLHNSVEDIAIISHDAVSSAGRMSRFSSLTGVPIFYVDKQHSLAQRISQCAKRKLILIDTVSLSPENPAAEAQLQQLALLKQVKSLLVLPATGEPRWLARTIKQYRQPNSVGCVLSHIDQAESMGEMIALMLKEKLLIHYLSDGGLLPKYINTPSRANLMSRLKAQLAGIAQADTDVLVPTVNMPAEDASTLASG